jgi:hypothetical protein
MIKGPKFRLKAILPRMAPKTLRELKQTLKTLSKKIDFGDLILRRILPGLNICASTGVLLSKEVNKKDLKPLVIRCVLRDEFSQTFF